MPAFADDEPQVIEKQDEGVFKVEGNWSSGQVSRSAKATITFTAPKTVKDPITYDILYLVDMGSSFQRESIATEITESIARVKEQTPDARFAVMGFSNGITYDSNGFSADCEIGALVEGTLSNWADAFDNAKKLIDDRDDKSRPAQVVFLTSNGAPTKNGVSLNLSVSDLKKSASNISACKYYDNTPQKLQDIVSSSDDLFFKTNSYSSLIIGGLEGLDASRVSYYAKDVDISVPIEDSFSNPSISSHSGYDVSFENPKIVAHINKIDAGKTASFSVSFNYGGEKKEDVGFIKKSTASYFQNSENFK